MLILFETMMDNVIGDWIKLLIEELNNLNSPPNIGGVINYPIISSVGRIASICEEKCLQAFGG
jgi:hypothetical protein